jgi:hypothetical protein
MNAVVAMMNAVRIKATNNLSVSFSFLFLCTSVPNIFPINFIQTVFNACPNKQTRDNTNQRTQYKNHHYSHPQVSQARFLALQ